MPIVDFETECWADPWFQTLKPVEKLLFIYLWTNPHRNISGIYTITFDTISFETCLTKAQIRDLLLKLSPKVKYDFDRSICWVVKHARRQFLRGEKISFKQREGIRRNVLKFRWHPFFKSFCDAYPEIFLKEEIDTLSKGIDTHSMGMDTLGGGGKGNYLKERGGVGEKTKSQQLFDKFWNAYPKQRNKGQAEKAFKKVSVDEQLIDRILTAIERAKKSPEWLKDDGQFIPYPATWLNAKGWEDEFGGQSQEKCEPAKDQCKWCREVYLIKDDHECKPENIQLPR